MERRRSAIIVIAALAAGCSGDKPAPTGYEIRTPLFAQSAIPDKWISTSERI